MKKLFTFIFLLMALCLTLPAVESASSIKIGPSWINTDIDMEVDGYHSHGSSAGTGFTIFIDSDLYFGNPEILGLRIGMDVVSFPITAAINGQMIDVSGASPAYVRFVTFGLARKLVINEKNIVTLSPSFSFSWESESVPNVADISAFTLGIIADVEYAYKPASIIGLKLGVKLGVPILTSYKFTSYNSYVPSMSDAAFPKGFFAMPYIGIGFYI